MSTDASPRSRACPATFVLKFGRIPRRGAECMPIDSFPDRLGMIFGCTKNRVFSANREKYRHPSGLVYRYPIVPLKSMVSLNRQKYLLQDWVSLNIITGLSIRVFVTVARLPRWLTETIAQSEDPRGLHNGVCSMTIEPNSAGAWLESLCLGSRC